MGGKEKERKEGREGQRKDGWMENGREERGRGEVRRHLYSRIVLHGFDVYDVTSSGKK